MLLKTEVAQKFHMGGIQDSGSLGFLSVVQPSLSVGSSQCGANSGDIVMMAPKAPEVQTGTCPKTMCYQEQPGPVAIPVSSRLPT